MCFGGSGWGPVVVSVVSERGFGGLPGFRRVLGRVYAVWAGLCGVEGPAGVGVGESEVGEAL